MLHHVLHHGGVTTLLLPHSCDHKVLEKLMHSLGSTSSEESCSAVVQLLQFLGGLQGEPEQVQVLRRCRTKKVLSLDLRG